MDMRCSVYFDLYGQNEAMEKKEEKKRLTSHRRQS